MSKLIDLTGQKFGRLTVIQRAPDYISPSGYKSVCWLCECNCEEKNIIVATGSNLKAGHVKSCGCLVRENIVKVASNNKKYNKYDLSGEYGIGWASNTNEEFYFDLEDYDKIKDYCWNITSTGYVHTNVNNKHTWMHRVVTDCPDDMYVDHIGGDETKNNNRKYNLRICTIQENGMNSKLQSNNTSGYTGVVWNKRENKWMANIKYNNKRIHLGYFINFEDAVKARQDAEEIYFGEFSRKNSKKIIEQYKINNLK